jgi:hypothetical protein
MKIISIEKRVGITTGVYNYLAHIDLETDVTKENPSIIDLDLEFVNINQKTSQNFKNRYKRSIFTLEELQKASNINMFKDQIGELDVIFWKRVIAFNVSELSKNIKFFLNLSKSLIRKNINLVKI